MFTLTQEAKKQLDAYFADKTKSPIRIYLASGGCSGPSLALALDDPKDDDDVFPTEGYTFVVEKTLMEKAKPLTVDLTYMGFEVRSNLELGGGSCCGTCSCSSGSCGS